MQDAADAVLAHEDRCVRIMDEISGEPRKLGDHLGRDVGMTLGRDKNGKPRRRQKRR